jgi:hypothetical protein
MHNLDLGVYEIIAACALLELVAENVWPAASEDERFALAHADYKAFCKEHKLQPCSRFEKSKLHTKPNECPTFTHHQAKANQTKYIVIWLNQVMSRPGIVGDYRKTMFKSFVEFENICAQHGPHLPREASLAIADRIEAALLCFNALTVEAHAKKSFYWQQTPKAHMTSHMAYDFAMQGRNPRTTTCYPDEDMVGKMKILVEACHGKTAPQIACKRYAILVCVRWWTELVRLRFW